MSTCNLWFLLGWREERGSLFLNLLRNILSCYFLSAFELPLVPVPFIGAGWKAVECNQHILRGHSPCTCSFLLVTTCHKGTKDAEENSQFFPSFPFPQSQEFSYTIGYAIWYPAKVFHPRECSLDLELTIHLQTALFKYSQYWKVHSSVEKSAQV